MRAGQIDLLNLAMPITIRPSAPVSDEELMRFSEQNRPHKIERNKAGDLTIMTPVGGIGSTHERYLTGELYIWTRQDGRGVDFSPNVGFNLPDGSCLSPDASWITLERWNTLTLSQKKKLLPFCPDFLAEIRSESDRRSTVEAKMQTWLDNGAQLAWLIDPIDGNVTIYRPGQPPELLDHPDAVTAGAPVDGFSLLCGPFWQAD